MISALLDRFRSGRGRIGFFLVLLLPACGQRSPRPVEPIVARDSLGISIIENDIQAITRECHLSDEPVITIGEADGEEPYLLYRVFDSTRLSDGRIAVVNQGSYEVRIYDDEGRFLYAFGRQGDGPGEFRSASRIWTLPGDTLWVGDYRPWRFQVFSPDGDYIRGIRPEPVYSNPPRRTDLLGDGRSILGAQLFDVSDPSFKLTEIRVVLHANNGIALDTLGYYPNGTYGQLADDPTNTWTYPLFESFFHLSARNRSIAIGHGATSEISIYDTGENMSLARLVRWKSVKRSVTAEHVQRLQEEFRERYADLDETTRSRVLAGVENPDRPVRGHFPAFNDLLYGTDDRLWIRAYPIPGESEGQSWHLFDVEGRFQCSVVVPEGLDVDEAGRDYVLGKDTGESGEERIVMYALEEPSIAR